MRVSRHRCEGLGMASELSMANFSIFPYNDMPLMIQRT